MDGSIISITNHKGGVGKTATSINLGHALAKLGKKTLVIDMDLQCNSTNNLFGDEKPKYSLYDVFKSPDLNIDFCIRPTVHRNLYILPNTKATAVVEIDIISQPNASKFEILKDKIRNYVKERYDFVLIDCPPNLGAFVLCALTASDYVIVPSEAGSKYSLEGLEEAVSFIEDIREEDNPDLKLLKVLITKVDHRMLAHKATVTLIRENYPPEKVFNTTIPLNTAIQQAEMKGTTVFRHRPNASAAYAYTELAKEIISSVEE